MTSNSENRKEGVPAEYEREIRELYRERNARTFMTPQGKARHFLQRGSLVVIVVVSVIVSALASFVVVTQWLALVPLSPSQNLIRAASSGVEVTSDQAQHLMNAAVTIFTARPASGTGQPVYVAGEALAQGLVLSSDGWVVTMALTNPAPRNFVAVTADGTAYPVIEIVTDPVMPLWFIKINASNLAVTAFVDSSSLVVDQSVMAVVRASQALAPAVYVRRLAQLAAPVLTGRDLTVSSEALPDRYLLDAPVPAGMSAPVSTLKGDVIGLLVSYNGSLQAVLPLDTLGAIIDTLFANQVVGRPVLGVNYEQSSWVGEAATGGSGALLAAGGGRPAVQPKSPAAAAGLQAGDRIVTVGDERLAARSLSALLQHYRPGASVPLTVVRQGQERTVTVTLGQLSGTAKKAAP